MKKKNALPGKNYPVRTFKKPHLFKRIPRTGDKFYVRDFDGNKSLCRINWVYFGYTYSEDSLSGNTLRTGKKVDAEERMQFTSDTRGRGNLLLGKKMCKVSLKGGKTYA